MEPTTDGFIKQSRQDDLFEEVETFAQCVYLCLTLTALKRQLSEEELHLLERAITVGEKLGSHQTIAWTPKEVVLPLSSRVRI